MSSSSKQYCKFFHCAEATDRDGIAACQRGTRTRIKPLPYFHEPAVTKQLPQRAPDQIVAAEIPRNGAQKHIAALAVDAFEQAGFDRTRRSRVRNTTALACRHALDCHKPR